MLLTVWLPTSDASEDGQRKESFPEFRNQQQVDGSPRGVRTRQHEASARDPLCLQNGKFGGTSDLLQQLRNDNRKKNVESSNNILCV